MSDKKLAFDLRLTTVGTLLAVSAACGPPPRAVISPRRLPEPAPAGRPIEPELPKLPIIQMADPFHLRPTVGQGERITLTATNAQVREILPVLASAAGVSLVMGSDVTGRISLNLRDVPALDALKAVIDQAGLTVGGTALKAPFGPVVFYQPPVNVNVADSATIRARYDVTREMAGWVVVGRRKDQ